MGELHEVINANADTARLAQTLATHPDAAREKDRNGKLPLHWALVKQAA